MPTPIMSRYRIAAQFDYRDTSNISCSLVVNKIDAHSDVVGTSPVGAAPTTWLISYPCRD